VPREVIDGEHAQKALLVTECPAASGLSIKRVLSPELGTILPMFRVVLWQGPWSCRTVILRHKCGQPFRRWI